MSSTFLKQPLVLVFFGGKKSYQNLRTSGSIMLWESKQTFRFRFFENFQRTDRSHERTHKELMV